MSVCWRQSCCFSGGEGRAMITEVRNLSHALFSWFLRKTACGCLLEALVHLQALVFNVHAQCSQMCLFWGIWEHESQCTNR